MDRRAAVAFSFALALLAGGCGTARDVQGREAGCASCHGVPTSGAHVAHVEGKLYAAGFECSTCHAPEGFVLLTHTVGGATVAFTHAVGGIGTYVPGTQTCSNTYCHGTFPGGTGADPVWTAGPVVGCSSCHGAPPTTGEHNLHLGLTGVGCGSCHTSYTQAAVNLQLHVDGTRQVTPVDLGAGTAAGAWDPATRSCAVTCHGQVHDTGMAW